MAKYVAPWVIVITVCSAGTHAAQTRVRPAFEASLGGQPARLMPGSPLVATADALFAIADDQRNIAARPAAIPATWQLFGIAGPVFGRVGGLAVSGDVLYVTDRADESVFRVDIRTHTRTLLYKEGPLRNPGSIAVARDAFVVDDSNDTLYRIRDNTAHEVPLVFAGDRIPGPLLLAAAGDDLFITSPAGILELRGIGRVTGDSAPNPAQQSPLRKGSSSSEFVFSVGKRDFPEITKPSRMAIWKGIVYVVDDAHQAVFAFGRDDYKRPVKLVRESSRSCSRTEQAADKRAADKTYCVEFASSRLALAVNETDLFLLAGDNLTRSPRPVPVEVVLPPSSVSEAMTDVYAYLQDKKLLATREVALEKNVEATLKEHGVLLAAYPRAFTPLLCGLNPGLCDERQQIKLLQAGRPVIVPDLPYESFVDAIEVTLDGKETLEEVARRNVRSPELSAWVSEQRLREMNDPKIGKDTPLRNLPPGRYLSPVEYVRYVVPAYATDARGGGALKRLEAKYNGLQVQSLEEKPAKGADAAMPGVNDPAYDPLKSNYAAMLKMIGYDDPDRNDNQARVGIAERFIDQDNPDFGNAWIPTGTNPVPAGGGDPNTAYRIRSFEDNDHGTMVAALVGARKSQFDYSGLAPRAMLLSLQSTDPAIGNDIRQAFLRNIRIFNISAHYGKGVTPTSLQTAINKYGKALFVVAAGNDAGDASPTGEICADVSFFPACWSDRKNVIVVTATRLDGTTMLAAEGDKKGANWSATAVHLAAPGEGYHVAGASKSYVPARGSSFAAPLVTAAAALLYAQNVTDPWVIKQRLIATADPQPGLAGKVFAGRINIKRALADTGFGVLVKQTKNAQGSVVSETRDRITVDSGDVVVTPAVGNNKTIPATSLRRVHVYGGGYRIVYVEDDQIKILEGANFPSAAASKFRATSVDGTTRTFDLIDYVDYIASAASLDQ